MGDCFGGLRCVEQTWCEVFGDYSVSCVYEGVKTHCKKDNYENKDCFSVMMEMMSEAKSYIEKHIKCYGESNLELSEMECAEELADMGPIVEISEEMKTDADMLRKKNNGFLYPLRGPELNLFSEQFNRFYTEGRKSLENLKRSCGVSE